MTAILRINGAELEADPSGALWWPGRATLIVADLHFEKGSSYAPGGRLLPPYDTAETLARLAALIERHQPARVICLGDSLHDGAAAGRIAPADRARLQALVERRDWIWLEGNHDPAPHGLGGRISAEWNDGPLTFRHAARIGPGPGERRGGTQSGAARSGAAKSGGPNRRARPVPAPAIGEISGHYHPCARMNWRGRSVSGRCFVHDGARLVMPAFGAYTGGLDVADPAISGLFPRGFRIDLIGRTRIHRFDSRTLVNGRDG
jgi:DNA ligase-associated metallophosphoesterase